MRRNLLELELQDGMRIHGASEWQEDLKDVTVTLIDVAHYRAWKLNLNDAKIRELEERSGIDKLRNLLYKALKVSGPGLTDEAEHFSYSLKDSELVIKIVDDLPVTLGTFSLSEAGFFSTLFL